MAATNAPVPVVDDDHNLVGAVDRISVMLALGGSVDAPHDPTASQGDNGQMSNATDG